MEKPVIVSPGKRYIKHKVKRKETLYSISKKYNISVDDLLKANIKIKETGLQKGMIINIPTKDFLKQALWQAQQDSLKKDSILKAETKAKHDTSCKTIIFDKNSRLKIGLMLPFALDNKTLNIELKQLETNAKNTRPKVKPFFDMYQGLLLALEEYKKQGLNIDLYAYDTKKSPYTVKQLMQKPEIKQLDFLIGPVYSNTFDTAIKYKPTELPIINPLKSINTKNNNCIQLIPSKDIVMEHMTQYLKTFDNTRFIVIYNNNDQKSKDNTWIYSERLKHYRKTNNKDTTDIIKVKYENKIKNFTKYFDHNKTNIVIIPSENQAFVTDIITKLNISNKKDSVILFGFKSWMKYNIQTQYYHNLNLTLFANKLCNYNSENVKNFLKKYREEYNTEASDFSLAGYDILKAFTNFITKYNTFSNCLSGYKYHGLIYNLDFRKSNKYFENIKLLKVQFTKDFRLEISE